MHATTTNGSIVPTQGLTVQRLMSKVFEGLPIAHSDYCVSELSGSLTAAEFDMGVCRLDVVDKQVLVRSRFRRGDMWTLIHLDCNRPLLTAWLAYVRIRIPDAQKRKLYLHNMSEYGVVADRFGSAARSDKHNWTWYKTHNEDGSLLSAEVEAKPYFKTVRMVSGGSELWVECAGHHDKRIMVGLSSEVLESVRIAMGWEAK